MRAGHLEGLGVRKKENKLVKVILPWAGGKLNQNFQVGVVYILYANSLIFSKI